MKKIIPLFFTLSMLVLGSSCIDEVIKFVKTTDTVFVKSPPIMSFVQTVHYDTVWKEFVTTDTVEVQVVVHDVDTVVQIKTDSIFIEKIVEKIVNHYDTIIVERIVTNVDTTYIDRVVTIHDTIYVTEYEQTVVYLATTYLFPGQSIFSVPDNLMPYYNSFISDANARGKTLPGGDLIVQYVKSEDLPGEGWISSYVEMSGWQSVIFLDEGLLAEESKSALYRELGRMQLKKQYSQDINKIMSPYFPKGNPTVIQINELFK